MLLVRHMRREVTSLHIKCNCYGMQLHEWSPCSLYGYYLPNARPSRQEFTLSWFDNTTSMYAH